MGGLIVSPRDTGGLIIVGSDVIENFANLLPRLGYIAVPRQKIFLIRMMP